MRHIGLIINPYAGQGAAANLRTAGQAVELLHPEKVVTGADEFGSAAKEDWDVAVEVCPVGATPGREQTQKLARDIIARKVEALVVIGGDGTMADVAGVCAEQSTAPPILGIGVGSTNVGRLVTCRAEALAMLEPARLRLHHLDSVLAYCNGEFLGLGFNDGVIGFTVVGTINGQMRNISAEERMHGQNIPGVPRNIGTAETRVMRSGPNGALLVASGEAVGTVIVGFAESEFFGKAVTGGVCLTAFAGLPAGCLVSDRPLVQVEVDADTVAQWPPIVSRYVSLDEGSRIYVDGVRDGAALCADGNPLWLMSRYDRAEFAVRREAVTALHLTE